VRRPAQTKGGIELVRGLYDLRYTYATFALRADVPVFASPASDASK
jgi:hypothetical protein